MNKTNFIKIYLSLTLLLIPAFLSIIFPQLSGDSRIELRKLQEFPKLPISWNNAAEWPRKFDQFTSDRFPFRSDFIHFASRSIYKVGLSISREVTVGKDGWLFLYKTSNILNEHRGIVRLSSTELNNWVEAYIKRKSDIEQLGAKLFIVIVPNKHTIYKEQLPQHHSVVDKNITDQLVTALAEHKISQIIDLRPMLLSKASEHRLYGKFDSHWNDYGSYLGYIEIMEKIDTSQNIPRLTLNDISLKKEEVSGDLARLINNLSLKETAFKAKVLDSSIIQRINFENRHNFWQEEWVSVSKHDRLPVAVCFCDSFVNGGLYKYLEQSFSKTIFKHHRAMIYDKKLIEKYEPDYVFYIVVERLLPYKLNN